MQNDYGGMKVRFQSTGEEASVDMATLYQWAASGKLKAEDLVKGDLLTNGEWKTAGEMKMFHLKEDQPTPERTSWRLQPIARDRYPQLATISMLCRVAAVIILVGSVILGFAFVGLFATVPSRGGGMGILGFIATAVEGCAVALLFWALGELIPVFVDIEANTRRAKQD